MSKEDELKKRIAAIVGAGALASGLVAMPYSINMPDSGLTVSAAYASEGGSSGSGGSGESGGSGGSSGSGESGGTGGNSGSGSSGSGSSGSSGSSGESGESGGSDDSGESGESGESGDDRSSASVPDRFGRVVEVERRGFNIEVRYDDGGKEVIENGRYAVKDPTNRTVVERAATFADRARIANAGNRVQ